MRTLASKPPGSATETWALWAFIALAIAGTGAYLWHNSRPSEADVVFQPKLHMVEAAPLRPWREPVADRLSFFPNSTGEESVTLILSGRRLELQQRLGRSPEAEENSLAIHRIYEGDSSVGAMLTRRIKGENGAIELVLALDTAGRVLGLKFQRIREPESVAEALSSAAWLAKFNGRDAETDWPLQKDIEDLPLQARVCGQAIVEGVRSLVIMYRLAQIHPQPQLHH